MNLKDRPANILIVFITILVFQFFGNDLSLHATTSQNTSALELTETVHHLSKTEVYYIPQHIIKDARASVTETEVSEEEENLRDDYTAKLAVSHAFYASCLELIVASEKKFSNTSTHNYSAKLPLYLQFEVFRL